MQLQNILERFNPGARQLIAAGKSYLKALHGKHHWLTLVVVRVYLVYMVTLICNTFCGSSCNRCCNCLAAIQ